MTWEIVVLVLGVFAIVGFTILGWLHLRFLRADRKKKDEEYKKLLEILENIKEREENN